MSIPKKVLKSLIEESLEVKNNSYSKYSKFRVGCSLLCEDDTIVTGTNVENASFGLTICAERAAICSAVSQGKQKFKAVVVVSDVKDKFVYPCGACRQVLAEFGLDTKVYIVKPDKTYVLTTVGKLFPNAFLNLEDGDV